MAILIFVLGFVLLAAGLAGGYMSLDLLPTGPGLTYAFAGAVAVVGAIVVFALGALTVRVGALSRAIREQPALAIPAGGSAAGAAAAGPPLEFHDAQSRQEERVEPHEVDAEPEEHKPQALAEEADADGGDEAQPLAEEGVTIEEPAFAEIEQAETPELPPALIGRYSSGGANYMIFSDGSIEAETDEGAFKFASMGDFKQFLKTRSGGKV